MCSPVVLQHIELKHLTWYLASCSDHFISIEGTSTFKTNITAEIIVGKIGTFASEMSLCGGGSAYLHPNLAS
jgi:hypothetical protein